ncbi:hypothetical protein ABW19_dt0202629 [Dactylella cylindrospora]|nr:hypothetical protein ABW19_dt0202629 [Dactylella cylindrospora]
MLDLNYFRSRYLAVDGVTIFPKERKDKKKKAIGLVRQGKKRRAKSRLEPRGFVLGSVQLRPVPSSRMGAEEVCGVDAVKGCERKRESVCGHPCVSNSTAVDGVLRPGEPETRRYALGVYSFERLLMGGVFIRIFLSGADKIKKKMDGMGESGGYMNHHVGDIRSF